MVKWVTCREPQGRAIGKTHIDKEVHDFFRNEKLPLKTNIPIFQHSIILPPWRDEAKRIYLDKPFSIFPLWRDRNPETSIYVIDL